LGQNETNAKQDLPGGQKEKYRNHQQFEADPRQTYYSIGSKDSENSGEDYRSDKHFSQSRHRLHP